MKMWWSRISNGTAILMKKMFGIVFGSVIIYSIKLLGIERKFKVFMLIRKRGSVFNR